MELLVSFLFTLALMGALFWVMRRSGQSHYRPSREQVLELLEGVLNKQTSQRQWDLFIGLPIVHDPELEQIRRRCLVLSEGDLERPPFPAGIGGYLFNRAGREYLSGICAELRELIRNAPYTRGF